MDHKGKSLMSLEEEQETFTAGKLGESLEVIALHPAPSLYLILQESGHFAVELVGKLLHSAAPSKHILPKCMGSQPAMLTGSAERSCTCVKTVASPAHAQMPMHSTKPCIVLPETVHQRPTHEANKHKKDAQRTGHLLQAEEEQVTQSSGGHSVGQCIHSTGAWRPGRKMQG